MWMVTLSTATTIPPFSEVRMPVEGAMRISDEAKAYLESEGMLMASEDLGPVDAAEEAARVVVADEKAKRG